MFNNKLMQFTMKIAEQGLLNNEIPVGAIIVDSNTNHIISQAHNLVEQTRNPTAHAEMLVITHACHILQSKSLAGLDLYVTLQPCTMCLQAIIYAKIRRVYFGTYDHSTPINLVAPNHNVEIYGGINESSCKALLDKFFMSKRC